MVYSDYAFDVDAKEKYLENQKEYKRIKDKAVVKRVRCGYGWEEYEIEPKEGVTLTEKQKALIADSGNLCFGYRMEGSNIHINLD